MDGSKAYWPIKPLITVSSEVMSTVPRARVTTLLRARSSPFRIASALFRCTAVMSVRCSQKYSAPMTAP